MFSYKVKIYDGEEEYTDLGIVAGSSYTEASTIVEKYFEDDDIISLELFAIEDSETCIVSLADVKSLAELFHQEKEEDNEENALLKY